MSNHDKPEYWDIETGEPLYDDDLHDRYDDMLDEVYGPLNIAGMEYSTAETLKQVDPTAYRVGFSDWLDAETDETITDAEPTTDAEDEDED